METKEVVGYSFGILVGIFKNFSIPTDGRAPEWVEEMNMKSICWERK